MDAPDRGSSEQMFYGDYDHRFGKERTEEARSSIQQARSARYDTRRSTVARGTTLLTAFSGNGLVATRTLSWSGPKGSEIGIGFDDEHFGLGDMRGEIERMEDAYPNPPNEVPQGTSFVFSRDSTGHLDARFRMGDTVYQNVAECSLHHRWGPVHVMNQLVSPA